MNGKTPPWQYALLSLLVALFVFGCSKDQKTGGPLAFGGPCAETEDCRSLLCVRKLPSFPVGSPADLGSICSKVCSMDADCPTPRNWGCAAATDFGPRVCACTQTSVKEVCGDGLDNDCNGTADDCQLCNGAYVATDTVDNCGACGRRCGTGELCVEAECKCPPGLPDVCGNACTDLTKDSAHCGSCDTSCGTARACQSGKCACTDPKTPDYCNGSSCVNLQTDIDHCGDCGTSCFPGETCSSGRCTCPAPTPDACGTTCTSLQTDEANCGVCGVACGAGKTCTAGQCTCQTTLPNDCGGTCTSTESDTANCGACGNACSLGQVCTAGACTCNTSTFTACGASCYNLTTDSAHCGGCDTACKTGEYCSAGACHCDSGLHCNGACVPASDSENCGACGNACTGGRRCSSGSCTCPLYGDSYCAATDACTNLSSDEANCGTCGNACAPSQVCSYGVCACSYPATFCSGTSVCANLQSDQANCGTCGTVCKTGQICSYGTCTCPASGQLFCASTGACTDTMSNTAHCGACDAPCKSGQICSYGSCQCASSNELWCAGTGTCTDVSSSAAHCGSCTIVCPANTNCTYGQCTCTATSQTLCGTSCVDLQTDAKHCGGCGAACTGNMVCTKGVCSCADPTVGTAIRLTTTASDTGHPAAAWDGTHLGVAYTETTSAYPAVSNVVFALLNPNGTRARATDVAVSGYVASTTEYYPTVVGEPAISSSGTEFAVVWLESSNTGNAVMLRRFDATGAPKGAAKSVSIPADSTANPSIAWSSTYGGYAISSPLMYSGSIAFQRIGADGTNPDAVNTVNFTQYSYSTPTTRTLLSAAPDGRWSTLTDVYGFGEEMILFNADGSRTVAPANVDSGRSGRGDLVWAGTTWLEAHAVIDHVYVNRGTQTNTPFAAVTIPAPYEAGEVKLDVDQTVTTLAWTQGNPSYDFRLRRFSAGPNSSLTPLTSEVTIVATPTVANDTSVDLARMGTTALGAVWSDTRWGAAGELYFARVDLGACP